MEKQKVLEKEKAAYEKKVQEKARAIEKAEAQILQYQKAQATAEADLEVAEDPKAFRDARERLADATAGVEMVSRKIERLKSTPLIDAGQYEDAKGAVVEEMKTIRSNLTEELSKIAKQALNILDGILDAEEETTRFIKTIFEATGRTWGGAEGIPYNGNTTELLLTRKDIVSVILKCGYKNGIQEEHREAFFRNPFFL